MLEDITKKKLENGLREVKKSQTLSILQILQMDYFEDKERRFKPEFNNSTNWKKIEKEEKWGGYDKVFWFRKNIEVPESIGEESLFLRVSLEKDGDLDVIPDYPESLLFVNGQFVQGIDKYHKEAIISPKIVQGNVLRIYLRSWTGLRGELNYTFSGLELYKIEKYSQKYYFLAKNVLDTIDQLSQNDIVRVKLFNILNESYKRINFIKPRSKEYYESIKDSYSFLQEELKKMRNFKLDSPKVVLTGHSHIDMAWLWTVLHTREKAQRTFSTVLNLMQEYPEYIFMHSSPALYKFLKNDYPELYEKVKQKIKEGRWEATGGMWIESDSNISPGEFLIRQILFGKRFLKEEFGIDSKVVWLPDAFGYTYALPQIIKKSGMKYFATTKISWNEINKFPYDTFWWKGIDGTKILSHFITTPDKNNYFYTYNGMVEPFTIRGIWDNYKQKDINDELLLVFGWGDGGGGPTYEMLENYEAIKEIPGLPQVDMGRVEDYFEKLGERIRDKNVPVWDDELYFELHRGTYTSQAFVKRENRKSEVLYHNAELLNSMALKLLEDFEYPKNSLNEGWELLLLNQFHDILPGSSIREVYEDARRDFEKIKGIANKEIERAISMISKEIKSEEDSLVLFNTTSFERDEIVELENGKKTLVRGIPPFGYKSIKVSNLEQKQIDEKMIVKEDYIENRYYIIEFNEKGQLKRLYDKENKREVLEEGKLGNVLQTFEDKPYFFDAWDISPYFNEKMKEVTDLIEVKVEEETPLKGVLKFSWRFYDSTIEQRVIVYNHIRRIDFDTHVDWKEKQVLLKTAFPVNIRSTKATYNIQFGNIERSTTNNTSWDIAKFEVPAQKWADLSEANYGVSILNDCKHGYDIKENVMRLTLLRSPIEPDETADRTDHTFIYSLLPHAGTWRDSQVIQEAYKLNYSVIVKKIRKNEEGNLPDNFSFIKVNDFDVVIETIKKAEDDDSILIRLFEDKGSRKKEVEIEFFRSLKKVVECNLIEEEEKEIAFKDNKIVFSITPYEIKTFKVWF
ncbi:glycoside hydrolase family 38 [Petrotoga mobilis SJ95]|uniref:alpha-mannosidase n=1 Tax=Petrotoga mobilis (strain DSM 10674 / SJ95) TaxID=403833 RepID=A9BFV0_PETMO|nr:alpha-mannosidase [Petrotoga mobilis]ABX31446.1 glycoside hydrolase family 38 [Petrotoga mobilis SJ95]